MKRKPAKGALIAAALLNLAAAHGWEGVTAARLARKAKMPQVEAQRLLTDPPRAMQIVAEAITSWVLADFSCDKNSTPRDVLFAIFMLRFDILQQHRAGILALDRAARRSPPLVIAIVKAVGAQLRVMVKAARIESGAPCGYALLLGLGIVYAYAFHAWRNDGTSDLAQTMAALDRALRWAEMTAQWLQKTRPAA